VKKFIRKLISKDEEKSKNEEKSRDEEACPILVVTTNW
jgi:hypothetical protein